MSKQAVTSRGYGVCDVSMGQNCADLEAGQQLFFC